MINPLAYSVSQFLTTTLLLAYSSDQSAQGFEIAYVIPEESPVGTVIGHVIRDAQLDVKYPKSVLRKLRFRFLTPPPDYLSIEESTGRIVVVGRMDRDQLCRWMDKCVVREDVVVQPIEYFQMIKIAIDILDINDNSPYFDPDVILQEMNEGSVSGSGFVIPTARDEDAGLLGVQKYELMMREEPPAERLFELQIATKLDGSTEVKLTLMRPLDRETQELHRLKVIAYDGGASTNTGTLDLSIRVLDANDNPPVFQYGTYEAKVVENLPLYTSIIRVHAEDYDTGDNGHVTYLFSPSTELSYGQIFSIDNETGVVYAVGQVDYEQNPVFHLVVNALDSAPDPLQSETTVVIRVDDVNDNAPIITVNTLFESDAVVAKVLEGTDIGTFVAHVTGRDPDGGENGQFNCSLSDAHHFHLRPVAEEEYHVITAAMFDREQRDRYKVSLVCRDGGDPALVSVRHLRVDVIDVNDNAPKFSRLVYAVEVAENNQPGYPLVIVDATDRDIGPNSDLTYFLTENFSLPFSLNSSTGLISATISFDHEKRKEFRFTVLVRDAGNPSHQSAANILIQISDKDDEVARFSQNSYTYHIPEQLPTGMEVGQVLATDADGPPYNQFSYFLLPGPNRSGYDFRVDSESGVISTSVELDREIRNSYVLLLVASDDRNPKHVSTATVTVHVTDINDNYPVFLFPTSANHSVIISDSLVKGQVVTMVTAVDGDEGLNSLVSYSLIGSESAERFFAVNQSTGVVTVTDDVITMLPTVSPTSEQWRQLSRVYSLTIAATDSGTVPLESRTSLDVIVVKATERRSREDKSETLRLGGARVFVASKENKAVIIAVCVVTAAVCAVLLMAILLVACPRRAQLSHPATETYVPTQTLAPGPAGKSDCNDFKTARLTEQDGGGFTETGGSSRSSSRLITDGTPPMNEGRNKSRKNILEVCLVNGRAKNKVGYST